MRDPSVLLVPTPLPHGVRRMDRLMLKREVHEYMSTLPLELIPKGAKMRNWIEKAGTRRWTLEVVEQLRCTLPRVQLTRQRALYIHVLHQDTTREREWRRYRRQSPPGRTEAGWGSTIEPDETAQLLPKYILFVLQRTSECPAAAMATVGLLNQRTAVPRWRNGSPHRTKEFTRECGRWEGRVGNINISLCFQAPFHTSWSYPYPCGVYVHQNWFWLVVPTNKLAKPCCGS